MSYYKAFGLLIDSELQISMLEPVVGTEDADVWIRRSDTDTVELLASDPENVHFAVDGSGAFLIRNGNEILVAPEDDAPQGLLAVFLLGSCMGAILHQRNLFLLHGSCVTRGDVSVLITGNSGAGKSTLAAEFLSHGWKLLTDDVAVVYGIEDKKPVVQSSYPSQKLWQDAIERTGYEGDLFPLYQEFRREKYNIHVEAFREGRAPLSAVIRLIPTDDECHVEEVTGFAKVDQLMRNTYRGYMIAESDRKLHFQRCVTLSEQIRMFAALRSAKRNTTEEIYEKILLGLNLQL